MIDNYDIKFSSSLKHILEEERLQNPYLYMDANTYGFSGDNVATSFIEQEGQIAVILYRYYNSLQLLVNSKLVLKEDSIKDIVRFITSNKFVMVSGITPLIAQFKDDLPAYKTTEGYLVKYQEPVEKVQTSFPEFCWARTFEEFKRLAAFITTDAAIGSHYAVEQLAQQFLERYEKYGCHNVFVEQAGRIVGHAGTYASYKDLAIIGGLLVAPDQRGKGLARKLMMFLSKECLTNFHQQPMLYYYNPALSKFYESCSYHKIYDCSKLELIGE